MGISCLACFVFHSIQIFWPFQRTILELIGVEAMCKHILNAQVTIRYYDGNWYDCPLCFLDENQLYPDMQRIGTEMVFACKLCKKCFRKDMTQFEEPDEYCPHCGNCYVVEAVTPETLQEERLQTRLRKAAAAKEADEKKKNPTLEDDMETKLPSLST